MKIAFLNDTHCGIRNSSEIFLKNHEDFYSKVFFPYLLENDIKQIIHLGDYYDHRKFINFKAMNHNRKFFLEPLRKHGIKMDIIPGNHDTYYKNTNDLNSLKELFGHYMNEVHIVMEPTEMDYDGFKIGLIPWINAENYDKTMQFIQNCKVDVIGAHLELSGFDLMRGVKATDGMDHRMFNRFEMVISGHYHAKSQKDNVYYLGSQMEFFWSDAGDPKYFHVLDTETRQIEAVRNSYTLFEKVVYDDDKTEYNDFDTSVFDGKFVKVVVVNKKDAFIFDRFIDRVQNQDIHELKIAENFEDFSGDNVADDDISFEDTGEMLNSYVDAVDTELDKDNIKSRLSQFLTEAQSFLVV